jgi:hypothetical protein
MVLSGGWSFGSNECRSKQDSKTWNVRLLPAVGSFVNNNAMNFEDKSVIGEASAKFARL